MARGVNDGEVGEGEGRGFLGERSVSGGGTGADDCLVQ